jgi:hypothetical protein
MYKQTIISLAVFILAGSTALAQQALGGGQEIISPEIHEDQSVTFRLQAPQAGEVKLTGDWMPAEGWVPGSVAMTRDEKGLWTYTTEALGAGALWIRISGGRNAGQRSQQCLRKPRHRHPDQHILW